MGAGTRSFQDTEGNVYDLKDNEVNDFLKDFPDATEVKSFVAGKDTFDIPLNEVADFQKDYPDAQPLGTPAEVKKKEPAQTKSTTATPSSSLDIDKELKGKISDKDLYDYKQSRDRGIMGESYIAELKKKNPAIAQFEAKEAAIKASAPTARQAKQEVETRLAEKAKLPDANKILKNKKAPTSIETLKSKNQPEDVDFLNKQKKEFEQIQKDKEKSQFIANEDFITSNTTDGYLDYLRTNYPDKWEEIQTKKASGEWNRGADVEEEARIKTEHTFLGPAMAAYERSKAFFTGETNQGDDAAFYLEANNWAAKTQQDILGDIEKTDAFKQYKALTEQLNASPIGQQLKPINEGLDKLSKSKDFLEYQTLSQKGQKQNGKLSEQDYKRYQELAKTKDVAAFIELNKGREQVLNTPEGQKYAQAAQQVQQLQGTKEMAQYFKTSQGLQKTVGNLKAFATKFPKQFMASQIYQNYQKQADNAYKKMPTIIKTAYETLDAATDAGMQILGDASAGVLRLATTGYDLIGMESAAKFTNSLAGGITQLTEDLTNYYTPSSTQLQLPFIDSYVPYKLEGKSVRLYKNDKDEIIDVRDRDGYSMFLSQDDIQAIDKIYQDDTNKPQPVGDWTVANAPAKLSSTLVTLAGISLTAETGAALQLSQKATMFSYGYLTSVNGAYNAIKQQDPLISEDDAALYANFVGLLNGGLFTVTPQSLLGKEAVETGYKELGSQYINLLRNGMPRVKALTMSVGGQIVKHGGEGALFGVGMEVVNKGANAATNAITGRQSVDDEIKLSQMLESGGSMFIASTILGIGRIGSYRDKAVGDALFTGLKNYDRTLADFEQMANSGQITAQEYNRLTNLMTELKPIYDNLADMGEYNAQYKSALISLYAEKYQKQEQLNAMDTGEQPGMIGKAVGKVKAVLTKTPMPNRDAIVKELNDIDKKIESMAIVNNPDFIVYTTSAEEVSAEKIWSLQEVQAILKNPKVAQADKDRVIDQFNKQTELIGQIVNKMMDPKTPLAEKQKLYKEYQSLFDNTKFYKNEKGQFTPYTQSTLKVGKQYIFDPKSGKFLAIKGAVAEAPKEKQYTESGEEIIQESKIIGAQVELPKYFSQGEQYTRDQLQEKLKDPAFIADMKAGRVQVDVFNDLEMEAYIENITKERQAKERKLLNEGPRALGPGEKIAPTEPGPAEVLPDLKVSQLGDKQVLTEDGTLATVERGEDGNWYLNLENGKSRQIPVTDNANPTETIKQLGLKLPVEETPPVAIAPTQTDITTSTGQEIGQVTVADDGVTFDIPEVGQVTWLKFNYTNKGELKTADVLLPDGKKLKIKDTDIVYDMAVALSNQSRARLGVTPEVANGAIESIVQPIKQTFDKGMNAIYNVVVNAGDAAIHIEKAYEGEPLTQQEQAAALNYLVTAANTINKIDTQNAAEKQNIIDWLSEAYDQVSAAEVTMEGPSELGTTKQGAESIGATKGEPSKPTKQRIVKHPEISPNTQRVLKRIAGDQEGIDALTNAIKSAYEAGTSPMEAAKNLGYAGEEYKRYLEMVIGDMKPEISEVEVKPEAVKKVDIEKERQLKRGESLEQIGVSRQGYDGRQQKEWLDARDYDLKRAISIADEMLSNPQIKIASLPRNVANAIRAELNIHGIKTSEQTRVSTIIGAIKEIDAKYDEEEAGIQVKPEAEVKEEVKVEAPSRFEQEGLDMTGNGTSEQQRVINAIRENDTILRAGSFNGKKLTKEQRRGYERQLARDKRKLRELQTPREFTADALEANATTPVVKWKSTELPFKDPLEIYDAIAQNTPKLAPLMQEATEVTKQVLAIMDKVKVEGYPVSGGQSAEVNGLVYPWPIRIYGQLYNSNKPGRWENASLAIEQFKKELQDAKNFIANPPSDAELAKVKAQREAIVLAKEQKTKAEMESFRKNIDEEKIAADTRAEQFKNIVEGLSGLTPEQKAPIKNEVIADGKVAPFVMKAAIDLFAQENKLPTKTMFTEAPTIEEVATKLGVKPEEVKALVLDYIKNNNDKVYAEAYLQSDENNENWGFKEAVEKVLGDDGFLYPLSDFKKGDIVVSYTGEQYEITSPSQDGWAKAKNISDADSNGRILSLNANYKLYRLLKPTVEAPTEAEKMAKPIAEDVLKIETLFNNNGYDLSIDYDNEAVVTDKKTGNAVAIEELPENLQNAAEYYGEWISNIDEMVGDPMAFVAKTRAEYEGELVPYEEVGPEALPEGKATKLDLSKDLSVADVQSVIDNIKENGKPLSEFNVGNRVVWANDDGGNFMQYVEGTIEKITADDVIIKRFPEAKQKKWKTTHLGKNALVILKPIGEPIYLGEESIRKQPTEAEAVTKAEGGVPAYGDEVLDGFINELGKNNSLYINPLNENEIIFNNQVALELMSAFQSQPTYDENRIEIKSIRAFEKGKGAGKAAMQAIIAAADNLNITLSLTAVPFGNDGLKQKDLIKFYKNNGFVATTTSKEPRMERKPSAQAAEDATKIGENAPAVDTERLSTDLSSFTEKAKQAYYWNSFTPDKRGVQVVKNYQDLLESDIEKLRAKGSTDEQVAKYIDGFKSRFGELLSATGRTASSAVAGPAKFPVEKNRKALERERAVYNDFQQWRDKILNRKFAGKTTPMVELEKAQSDLAEAEKAHKDYIAINKIVRSKTISEPEKIAKLKELLVDTPEKAILDLMKPDFTNQIGIADYTLRNNLAKIKRLKDRVMELENKVSRGAQGDITEMKFDGGVVKVDYTKDRVQIMHDEKPSDEVRAQLKGNGWRWSSIDKAWQRKITDSAIRDAKNLTGAEEVKAEAEFAELPALEQAVDMQPTEEGKPQYIEGNPVGGTAEVGQYRPEFKENIVEYGRETTISLPDGTKHRAVYVLAPINSVLSSHNPSDGFRKTEGYPVDAKGNTTNDRDYEADKSAQNHVLTNANKPDFDLLLDTTVLIDSGPSAITQDGFVIGGGGRDQITKSLSPERVANLQQEITARKDLFGFKNVPTDKGPLQIYRLLPDYDTQYSKAASNKFNKSQQKGESDTDASLAFGSSLNENQRVKELLFDAVSEFDTIGDFFSNPAARRNVKELLTKNGFIADKDINKFFNENGEWTDGAKTVFKKGLFATLFDEDIVRMLGTEGNVKFMEKVAKEMPTLAKNFNLPADVNLKEEVQEAIRFQSQYQSSGLPDIITYLRNMPIFERPTKEGVIVWALLDMSTVRNNIFRGAIQSYTNSAEQASLPSMFSDVEKVMGKADFMELILNKIPNEERQIIKNAFADEGFGPRVEEQAGEYTRSMGAPRPKDGLGRYTRFSETSTGSKGEAVGRVEEPESDLTEFGRKYYAVRGMPGYHKQTGYPQDSIQHAAAMANMSGNGFLPKTMSLETAKQVFKNFPEIRFKKAASGSLFMQMETANGSLKMFNPFTAKPYDSGRGKMKSNPDSVIPPTTNPVAQIVEPATPPADDVLPQAERDFKNTQLFFDFNDDVQSVEEPGGKYFGFVSAANKIRKMTNLSKNEQEYFELMKDQVRNQTAVGKKKLAELREKIGDERATEIQNNIVNDLVESKIGRQLKKGEYATQTSTVTVSKDKYAVGSTQIKTAADVAYIARMIETENTENALLYMLDENGMLSLAHISSGGKFAALIDPIVVADHITAFKPKKVWIAHNHPSSTMKASDADGDITREIKKLTDSLGVELGGHVIVDFIEGKYIVLDENGKLAGGVYKQSDYKGAEDEIPVYINGKTATFDWSSSRLITGPDTAINNLADGVTALRAGENVKGGFLVMNRANIVIGHFYLTGVNDVQNIIKASSALGGSTVITYGNFNTPVVPVERPLPNGVQVIDHLTYQSERFTSALYEPQPVYDYTAVTMPRVEEAVLPYDNRSTKLQQAVQQAMVDGFLKFDEVMFNLYDGHFGKDVIKMRKALDEVKDAYDTLSFENEDWIDAVSTIKEVSNFNVDNFLKSIQSPQKKTQSLRQQYDDFASWFEYNFPEARPYYKIEFDSELGDAIFTINGEPIQLNGEPISYSRWQNNAAIQKQWYGTDKPLVKNQPQMVWVDKDLTPTPKQHITDQSYKLYPFQTHAVNAAIDYFEKGNKGFGLWDGQGVGKTREILAIANEMANRSGKPSLIITKNDSVIDQFKESAGAMSLRDIEYKKDKPSGIIIGTYYDFVGGKVGKLSGYGTVIFDEAHMLKNVGSKRSTVKEDIMEKLDHVVFATGTPMDKPSQLLYFAKYMAGENLTKSLETAGLKAAGNRLIPIKTKGGTPLFPEDVDIKDDTVLVKKGLLRWRNQMIQNGAMIRREFPFYGTFGAIPVSISKESIKNINYILSERPGKVGLMEANRYQEHLKIPYVLERVKSALDNGKQIVLFCTGVNPTEIKSMGVTVPQFASEFSDILTKQGIPHSIIFGDNAAQKIEEAKKFQRGETKVAIATIISGGTGIDLDDQVGDAPREALFVTLPWSADELDQAIRRVSRLNTKSPSIVDFLFADGSYPDEHKQDVVYGKMQTMRNIQAGVDPDVVEMNNWEKENEGVVNLEEPQLDDDGEWVAPEDTKSHGEAAAMSTAKAESAEPYDPAKEKKKAESAESLPKTTGSKISVGTSVPPAGGPRPTAPREKTIKEVLLGQKRTSIHARILQAMIDLGVPTLGEYHLNKKYLGVYEHLPESVKLRYSQNMFTALHEVMHWIDYSVMKGLTYRILSEGNKSLIDELEDLYLSLYPTAKERHDLETKVSEGLAVFIQYKLYDPELANQYRAVEREIFSPGGEFYHPKMTEAYDAFRAILDDVQSMSSAGRVSQRIASETPFDDSFTISGWDAMSKLAFKKYDESIPLKLWDLAAGDENALQASYFIWRDRAKLASNVLQKDSTILSSLSSPMYYAPNGKWTPLKYRMSDIVNNVVKVVEDNYADIKRIYPEMTTSLDVLRTYLIARRVYFMGVKRADLEAQIATTIADAQQDYHELLTYTPGTPEYDDKFAEFNSKHIRPLKLIEAKWGEVNDIINNEGGSVKEKNADFSPTILAFEHPLIHGTISTAVFDNKKGNFISEHDVTEVFNSLHPYMKNAARMYDFINDKVGIDMAMATGLMSREFGNQLKFDNAMYPGYASFQKYINTTVFEDDDFKQINGGGTSKLRHNLKWKGSEYAIIDPLMSQASMIFEVYRKGLWNKTLLKLASIASSSPELARGFMKLPMDYDVRKDDKGKIISMTPKVKGAIPAGVMQIKVYVDGKVKIYGTNDPALTAFFTVIDKRNDLDWLTKSWPYELAKLSKQIFERMTTGYYPFWSPMNITVDVLTQLINSRNGIIPIISTIKYGVVDLLKAVQNGATKQMQTMAVLNKLFPNRTYTPQQMNYVMEYLSLSGSSQTFFSEMERPEVVGALEKMFKVEEGLLPKIKSKFKGVVKTFDSFFLLPTEMTETITRATEVAAASEQGKGQEQAMFEAKDIAPFKNIPADLFLRAYQGVIPYLRAQTAMSGKQLYDNPKKTAMFFAAMLTAGALAIINVWEDLTEDEKNYYRGLDGRTASMYLSIPAKYLGGKPGEIRQFRIPESIGSGNAMGTMWAIAYLESGTVDAKQMANAISSNIPSIYSPYDWTMSDKTVLESASRQVTSSLPIPIKTLAEIYSNKKVTYFGTTPVIPRQTESFPTEYQYKIGLGGTSSTAKKISELMQGKASPAHIDLVLDRQFGRTGKLILDLIDNKELKNVFLKTTEDIATNNKYYADFWSRYNEETGEFNVMRNIRYADKIPKPGEPGYEDWKKEVRQKAETSEIYSSTHFMVMELLKMRDWARFTNNDIDVNVYNQMNHLMQGLYENKSNDVLMRDVHNAYRSMKTEASRIKYKSDVDQFNNYNDITKIDKYQIKLKTLKMIKGIK